MQGLYGNYQITLSDEIEVKKYRIALLVFSISFCITILQWILLGSDYAWIGLIIMSMSIGLALNWIHIYIKLLHQAIRFLWLLGTIGMLYIMIIYGPSELLSNMITNPYLMIICGPLFAAITGIGFKEFFCFRRPEAIGLTILIPITLIGNISQLISGNILMIMLAISALLSLILSTRKFGMDASLDIGDKSVFSYLENNNGN